MKLDPYFSSRKVAKVLENGMYKACVDTGWLFMGSVGQTII